MTGSAKWILGLLAAIVVAIGCVVVYVVYTFDPCDTEVHSSTRSPDVDLSVVIFARNCGATVPFNTQVALAPAERPFRPDKGQTFLVLRGKHADDIVLRWTAARTLEVTLPQGEQEYWKKEARVGGIAIEYR